ncbi:TPA: HAD family phosphatase [Candidatus Woesearchaeota archaeon]|nr:HAD family phosphatase [Candidatus Woesearchaeota archaeon]
MITAVIFDHDGVIADTEPLHFRADNAILARYGASISAEANDGMVGMSTRKSWEIMRELFRLPQTAEWLAGEKTSEAVKIIRQEGIKPNEGLLPLLGMFRKAGFVMAIASGQYRRVVDAVISTLGISEYFSSIVTVEDVSLGKPNPEPFLAAAGKLGIPPVQCIAIEDSSAGVASAKAAGMKCIALKTPSTASHDFSMADKIVNGLKELQIRDFTQR